MGQKTIVIKVKKASFISEVSFSYCGISLGALSVPTSFWPTFRQFLGGGAVGANSEGIAVTLEEVEGG